MHRRVHGQVRDANAELGGAASVTEPRRCNGGGAGNKKLQD